MPMPIGVRNSTLYVVKVHHVSLCLPLPSCRFRVILDT